MGKSWLAKELGSQFDNFVELNFEKNLDICNFFQSNLDPRIIIKNLSNFLRVNIQPGKTLLFLDEVQECPRAIMSLRYFYEDLPELHVIAAGSLLEFQLENISVPVGRLNIMYVYPLSFSEYLTACGMENLREMLMENLGAALPEPIHKQLIREVANYSLVGGMPEAVADYLEFGEFDRCKTVQTGLIETYRTDFKKYAKKYQVKYVSMVFDSVPLLLGNKFKYAHVSRDIKSRELSEALDLLEKAGIVYRIYHSSSNGIPLKAESDIKKFKVLFFDIGLAQRLLKIDHRPLMLDPDITQVNNGAIAELLAGLELIAYQDSRERAELFYWHRESKSSNAEVDYVTTLGSDVVPVEVKSGSYGSMKSLRVFLDIKNRDLGIKISEANFSMFEDVRSIPFYGIESLVRGDV